MRALGRLSAAVFLLLSSAVSAQDGAVVTPPESATTQGVPPIPASIAEALGRYAEYRTAHLVAWHPQQREMLIATRFGNTFQLHHVKAPGGARTQLTFAESGIAPSGLAVRAWFEPKTGHIIYIRDITAGKRLEQYFHYDPATAKTTMITDGRSRHLAGAWSRQGDRFAYTANRRAPADFDLYVMTADDPASERKVAELKGQAVAVDWTPDGKSILVREVTSATDTRLWIVDVATGAPTQATPDDKAAVAYGPAAFSRDGRTIFVVTDRGAEFRHVARLKVGARSVTRLSAQIEGDVDELAVSPDGRWVAFSANEDGIGTLHLIDATTGGERARPKVPPGNVTGLKWRSSGELGFHLESARQPFDVFSYNRVSGAVTRWTFSEMGGVTESELRDHQIIKWKSFDGRMISGILHRPHPRFTGRRPVMISIHGGPEAQARTLYWGRSLYFLNELGVAIVQPNVRGSSGFGKTFVSLDDGRKREDAVKDVGALLDWITAQPGLDPERVWVLGPSYGGYMALAVAATYPDRIRCAAVLSGISNFNSFLERTAADRKDLRRVEYGDERDPEMREYLDSISPLTHADAIKAPLLIVHGKNDVQVPLNESRQIVEAVRKNGTAAWFVVFGDEGHEPGRRANVDYVFYAWGAFAQQYLVK